MSTKADKKVIAANKELLETILNYDSDTFFAKGCALTYEEAKEMAARSIQWFINNRLDGVLLDFWLAEMRGL